MGTFSLWQPAHKLRFYFIYVYRNGKKLIEMQFHLLQEIFNHENDKEI